MKSFMKDRMFIRAFFVVIFLVYFICGEAQTIRFEHLTSSDGISQSEVYAFLEDSKGFMWIGTLDGLNRYDGYNIEVFNTNRNSKNSLSNNTIRSLREDHLGRIWIGTDDGLNYYDPATELIYQVKVNSTKSSFSIWSMCIHGNRLLLGTNEGLWTTLISGSDLKIIESEFIKVKHFSKNMDVDPLIRTIIQSKYGGLWIQTSDNISRVAFQEHSDELIVIEDLLLSSYINQVTAIEDSSGNLWIGSTIDGLSRYNPETQETTLFTGRKPGLTPISRNCSALALDYAGNLWVGTPDKGISFAKAETLSEDIIPFTSFQNAPNNLNSLNSNLIYSLYVSEHNKLWVGTIGSGINIYNPEQKKFHHYKFYDTSVEVPNSNFIRSIYADNKNKLWLGTHNDGLYLLNRDNGKFRKLGFESQTIFHILNYAQDMNFICTAEGIALVLMENDNLKILSKNSDFKNTPVFNVVKTKGDVFWLASLRGLGRIRVIENKIVMDTFYSKDTKPAISMDNCRVLYYNDKTNELLIGTEGGGLNIMKLDENQYPVKIDIYKNENNPQTLSNNYIRSIVIDSRENTWIGTYEGLNLMMRDTVSGAISFKTYCKKDGLPNNMIQLLVEDDNQSLWIGTNGGLSKFIPDKNEFYNYTVNDGIQSKEFSEHTVFKKPDGEIIVGGINGINAFYPDQIKNSSTQPKTTITGFYLFNEKVQPLEKAGRNTPLNKSIVLTDTIKLLPKQKNIGFEFSSMIYPNGEKAKYAYMLEGFESDWHITGAANRIASYTNLRHGKYRFMVRSTNADGIWGPQKVVFVHIKTPFKFTVIAYLIYILIIVLFFSFLSFRFTTKRNLTLQREHAEKLHNLDELRTRFFINISHDLRTPLTLITGPLDKLLLEEKDLSKDTVSSLQLIKRNVKRLSFLVEQLLDVRKSESGILSPKLVSKELIAFTKEEIAHFTYAVKKKGIKLKIKSTEDQVITRFDPAMISKVYFNLISNAIKFTDKGGIEIRVDRVNKEQFEILRSAPVSKYVRIEIKDSGRGISNENKQKIFDRFYQDQSQNESGYGIGLSHAKDLIIAHMGFIEVESEEGEGTAVRFFLPDDQVLKEPDKPASSSAEDLFVGADTDPVEYVAHDNKSAKTILVVEDNDDMRNFIANELKSQYNIVDASDGVEGFKIAESKLPDLIISDVMMPNMDGIEFCEKIKSNIKTSHIPVILLTAKIDMETKYKGIEHGADDFIPKPFEVEYLILRVKNLLHSREELRKLFQKSHFLEPSAVTVTSLDEKFLSKLKLAIENGMPDSDFSINSLESDMGMSHANFYRKIKSLTGQSGQELLQNMRMKRAHQILSENKGIRIAEVAYMVGFTNPKYFSKCFKETFGYAPSDL